MATKEVKMTDAKPKAEEKKKVTPNYTPAARQVVSVYKADGTNTNEQLKTPAVLLASIRPDIVSFVHTNMAKNRRQPYCVYSEAGMQHSAESWGTGRAVARVPRISGGGTSRSGQGAFGNQCRGGRMFAPTKVWRRWHRKINTNQKRYAVASALAATAIPSLVMARGHRVEQVPEIPLVLDTPVEAVKKTKEAVKVLESIHGDDDVSRARDSRKVRAGKGKIRNRRHVQRRGPLVVYNEDQGLVKAFRNLPGVELCHVDRLNLLQLAPGGHLGRFVIWTKGAFAKLDSIYGTRTRESSSKSGWKLPMPQMTQSDLTRIINSDEVQSKVRPAIKQQRAFKLKRNPLTNLGAMVKLNPYALALKRSEILSQERRAKHRSDVLEAKRKNLPIAVTPEEKQLKESQKKHRPVQKANYGRLM
jgi:large subunit ribosomal protein L4e